MAGQGVDRLKSRRHRLILQIIRETPIGTQEELAQALQREGVQVTQATVSRDIRELQLVKVPSPDGGYQYAVPEDASPAHTRERLARVLRDCLVDIDFSENLIVVKTLTGTAPAAAEAIDRMGWPQIIGSVAGDNTVLVVVRPREAVPEVIRRLQELTG